VEYFRPQSVEEALKLLGQFEDARPLAGGATLVAMMNADLLAPSAIVSLAGIDALSGIVETDDGITIGAMTRHETVAGDERLRGDMAIVRLGAAEIGHPAIRAVGTIGGSIAHADPAADYPTALTAAGADIEIAGATGTRRIGAETFFEDFYTTALDEGELVVAIHVPAPRVGGTAGYRKVARSDGDFAIASIAFSGEFEAGRCTAARVAVGGCAATPIRIAEVDRMLTGACPGEPGITAAARLLAEACDPIDDVRGSATYRRLLVERLLPDVFADAADTDNRR